MLTVHAENLRQGVGEGSILRDAKSEAEERASKDEKGLETVVVAHAIDQREREGENAIAVVGTPHVAAGRVAGVEGERRL